MAYVSTPDLTSNGRPASANVVGSIPATSGLSVKEFGGDGNGLRQTEITFTNVTLTITNVSSTHGYGSVKFYDMPSGLIGVLGTTTALTYVYGTTTDSTLASAVGSTAAASANDTLTTTEADLIASTATASVSGAASFNGVSSAYLVLNGTSTAADIYLNMVSTDNAAAGTVTVNGKIVLTWVNLGDN